MAVQATRPRRMTGLYKVATLLITLGPELSSLLLKQLPQEDIERVSSEIANTTTVPPEDREAVMDEFLEMSDAHQYILRGGMKYAREVLERTVGPQRANEILRKLSDSSSIRPFSFLRKIDPRQLLNFIRGEHPQTIALVLAYLEPSQAGVILGGLPPEQQTEIARRIARIERTSPEIIRQVERVLEGRLSSVSQDLTTVGGVKALVEILNSVDRGTEKSILQALEEGDAELAEAVHQQLFVFEDTMNLDDNSIRRLLREIDMKDLAYALKGSSEEVRQRFFRNMSKKAGEMLQEDMEVLGPVRLRDVENAQAKIVNIIRQLDEAGEIIISRGGEDAVIV